MFKGDIYGKDHIKSRNKGAKAGRFQLYQVRGEMLSLKQIIEKYPLVEHRQFYRLLNCG